MEEEKDFFEIKENAELGRYTVASKDLSAGEIFLNEKPFAYGPSPDSNIICLHCYGQTDTTCGKCGWPLHNDCEHEEAECELFSEKKIKFYGQTTANGVCSQLDCITPLRVLLAMEKDKERFEREILPMEYHEEARRDSKIFQIDQNNVVNYLKLHMKLDYSDDLIQRICGVLMVNAFGARSQRGFPLRVLYPKLAIGAHSCVPNTAHTIFPSEGYRLVGRAAVDIKAGENLYSCYTFTSYGTVSRQTHLKEGKYFVCKCQRCLDPTELGTHLSTLKCQKCAPGFVLPLEPTNVEETMWKCTNCEFDLPAAAIERILFVIQDSLEDVFAMGMTGNQIEVLEAFIEKYQKSLHPNHFILMNVRHNLNELYGRVPGFTMEELTEKHLERMIQICEEILNVTSLVEPGFTRSRAMILYEMHVPMILLAKHKFNEGIIDEREYNQKLVEIKKIIKESYDILEVEDPNSTEGKLASIAKIVLEHLESTINVQ